MSLDLVPVDPQELPAVRAFLASIFQVPHDGSFLEPRLFDWKYVLPRPDWDGPRGWVIREDSGRIAAHAGIWPVRFRADDRIVQSMHVIDWAASADSPGAGAFIYREMIRRTGSLLVIGGSDQARKLLGRLGLENVGPTELYTRPIRPWTQFLDRRGGPLWKNVAKLVRNTVWANSATVPTAGTWTAQPIDWFPESYATLLETSSSGWVCATRSPAMLNYMLACPANCTAFLLSRSGDVKGHLLLSRCDGQSRIADLWMASAEADDWAAAYSLALQAASGDSASCELTAVCSNEVTRRALLSNGFRLTSEKATWLYDPGKILRNGGLLQIQGLESDGFFRSDPSYRYAT